MNWYKTSRKSGDIASIRELIFFEPHTAVALQLHRISEAIINKFLNIDFPSSWDNESLNKQAIIHDVSLIMAKYFRGSKKEISNELLENIDEYLDRIAYLVSIEPKVKYK